MTPSTNRRTFLEVASSSVVAATVLNRTAAVGESPNERLQVGLIGCGGRGTHDAGLFQANANVDIAYVCGPDSDRLASAAKQFGLPSGRAVSDLRRLLDDPELDAVGVATRVHWHGPAAILAGQAAKQV